MIDILGPLTKPLTCWVSRLTPWTRIDVGHVAVVVHALPVEGNREVPRWGGQVRGLGPLCIDELQSEEFSIIGPLRIRDYFSLSIIGKQPPDQTIPRQ